MSFSSEDFRYGTPPRMVGSETEFTPQTRHPIDIKAALPPEYALAASEWLQNGGRLYNDVSGVLEYATPECSNARELVTYEFAGHALATVISERAQELKDKYGSKIYKRSAYDQVQGEDGTIYLQGMSAGHHENYAFFDPLKNDDARDVLLAYLMTRPIWSGAGIVGKDGFHFYQKNKAMDFLDGVSCVAHGGKRPFRLKSDRIEIRSGDGNMSPWAITHKFAFTSLFLRMIEHDAIPESLVLDGSKMKLLTENIPHPFDTKFNGGYSLPYHAASYQLAVVKSALAFASERTEIPRAEIEAAEELQDVLHDILEVIAIPQNIYILAGKVDWATKLHDLYESGHDLRSLTTQNFEAVMTDLKYEKVGLHDYNRFPQSSANFLETASIRQALSHPPKLTRAFARTAYARDILASTNDPNSVKIRWDKIACSSDSNHYKMFD